MCKFLLTTLLIIFSIPVLAQRISGRVVDSKSRLPVSYASIGLIKTNIGTTAGKDGQFTINTKLNLLNDSLIISSVGYNPVKISLQDESTAYTILLDKRNVVLKEVVVRKFYKKTTLPWNKGKSDFTHSTIGIKKPPMLTDKSHTCKRGDLGIIKKQFTSL